MILLLDHDDSFVQMLAHYIAELGETPLVRRVSALTLEEVRSLAPSHLVLSPGPGRPEHYPLTLEVIRTFAPTTPILGVCLGHQCIGAAFGGAVVRSAHPRHGMTSVITHDGRGAFAGIPSPISATRYHSLAVAKKTLPAALILTATAEDGEVMGIRHREYRVEGVQFHPESVLTEYGREMVGNFIEQR